MLITVLGGSVGLGAVAPAVADASEPYGHGWWNRLNDGATAATAVAPPDVPPDGMYVAGDVSGPQAIAAVAFVVDPGAALERLTLPVAASGVRGGVSACAVTGRIVPVHNGSWSDAPSYDAERCVGGTVDGDAVAFDVAPLATAATATATGYVAFAIVPAAPASRAVLDAPTPDSLSTTPPAAGAGGTEAAVEAGTPDATGEAAASPLATTFPPPLVAMPTATPSASPPAAAAGPTSPAAGGDDGGTARALLPVSTPRRAGWYGTLGGAIGGALLFGLLLFYSLGYGPLGARYDR